MGRNGLAPNVEFRRFLDNFIRWKITRGESNKTIPGVWFVRHRTYENRKTTTFAVMFRLARDLSGLERLNFATLCLEIRDLPTQSVCHGSTFNDRHHSVKCQDLKISTKNSPCELFWDVQYVLHVSKHFAKRGFLLSSRFLNFTEMVCIAESRYKSI